MGRKVTAKPPGPRARPVRECVVCREPAIGINFNASTCMSCKAFFRRHALHDAARLRCPFESSCVIDVVTRKFCACCRLKKCFAMGMDKTFILSDEQRREMREKILHNRRLREEKKLPKRARARRKFSTVPSSCCSSEASSHATPTTSSSASSSTSSSPRPSTLSEDGNSILAEYSLLQTEDWASYGPESVDPCSISLLELEPYFPCLSKAGDALGHALDTPSSGHLDDCLEPYWDDYCAQILAEDSTLNLDWSQPEVVVPLTPGPSNPSASDHTYSSSSSNPTTHEPLPDYLSLSPPQAASVPLESPELELDATESSLIAELTSACSHLVGGYPASDYLYTFDLTRASQLAGSLFARLGQVLTGLSAWRELEQADQDLIREKAILEMAAVRSVLLYDTYRDAWCLPDDSTQTSVYLKVDSLSVYCISHSLTRHKAFPLLFADEWKQDTTLFDLLTAVALFTPRPEFTDSESIRHTYHTYSHLLYRYLTVKYASPSEASVVFGKLTHALQEMRILNVDVQAFVDSCRQLLMLMH